jgi:hypothetical protein
MRYSRLIALTHFVEGREDDYNNWYQWVHLRDVMTLGLGVIAAQRFRKAGRQIVPGGSALYRQPYLCIYEVSDPQAMTRAHEPVFTDAMPISDAYDAENGSEVYFDEIAGITHRPGEFPRAEVIIERIEQEACSDDLRSWYVRERLPSRAALPGVIAGSVGQPNPHQMFEQRLSGLCAVYWTTDLEATIDGWLAQPDDLRARASSDGVSLDCYQAVMDRLTMIDVREASAEERRIAQRHRESLGDRVLKGPPASIRSFLS